ncbi:MAG TPA: molybdopterin-binding protein [Candidatus Limnocylindrales bacterium]
MAEPRHTRRRPGTADPGPGPAPAPGPGTRPLLTAELLSVGSELLVGETQDTNGGQLAGWLTERGVDVRRITAVPDELSVVADAFAAATAAADLVVSTGGLGPTPDDLTREAIAAVCGETPQVDADLEAWLRELWHRRGIPFPEVNLKQAWLIPSAVPLANPNGTAPGWLVDRPDGRVIVALPGPPREMRPMWSDVVAPRLDGRLGRRTAVTTLRLTGIGESMVADRLGDLLRRGANPLVSTYARADAVDVRISAIDADGRAAGELVDETEAIIQAELGEYVWSRDGAGWADALGSELERLGWTLSVVEIGTGVAVGRLLGDRAWLRLDESLAPDAPAVVAHDVGDGPIAFARRAREVGGSEVGLAVLSRPRRGDTAVSVAIVDPDGERRERRLVFLDGELGRSRSAIAAADVLLRRLRSIVLETPGRKSGHTVRGTGAPAGPRTTLEVRR